MKEVIEDELLTPRNNGAELDSLDLHYLHSPPLLTTGLLLCEYLMSYHPYDMHDFGWRVLSSTKEGCKFPQLLY